MEKYELSKTMTYPDLMNFMDSLGYMIVLDGEKLFCISVL